MTTMDGHAYYKKGQVFTVAAHQNKILNVKILEIKKKCL